MNGRKNYGRTHTPYKIYRGLKVPNSVNQVYFDNILSYESRKPEIFIATYPKCGTTWVQHIVYLLHNKGQPATHASQIIESIPFPEQDGFPKNGKGYLAIKHHLPSNMVPLFENSKHIHVVRNPLDTCVSFYHFLKALPGYHLPHIDDFFEDFLKGDVPYGNFFDHLNSWYQFFGKPNILFLTYESMKKNHFDAVRNIANFLELPDLTSDILNDVVHYSKTDFMKTLIDDSGFMRNYLEMSSSSPEARDVFGECIHADYTNRNDTNHAPQMIRKGCVGDWANHLKPSQATRIKDEFIRKTAGTQAENLWQDIFKDI